MISLSRKLTQPAHSIQAHSNAYEEYANKLFIVRLFQYHRFNPRNQQFMIKKKQQQQQKYPFIIFFVRFYHLINFLSF